MLMGCLLGVVFMVRFLVALTRDGKMHSEHAVRPGGLHYAADASRIRTRHRAAVANSSSHLAIGVVRITTALTWNSGSGPRETAARPAACGDGRQGRSRSWGHIRASLSLGLKRPTNRRSPDMRDIIFVALTIAFFLISIAYVKFCDRIR